MLVSNTTSQLVVEVDKAQRGWEKIRGKPLLWQQQQ